MNLLVLATLLLVSACVINFSRAEHDRIFARRHRRFRVIEGGKAKDSRSQV